MPQYGKPNMVRVRHGAPNLDSSVQSHTYVIGLFILPSQTHTARVVARPSRASNPRTADATCYPSLPGAELAAIQVLEIFAHTGELRYDRNTVRFPFWQLIYNFH